MVEVECDSSDCDSMEGDPTFVVLGRMSDGIVVFKILVSSIARCSQILGKLLRTIADPAATFEEARTKSDKQRLLHFFSGCSRLDLQVSQS